MRREDDGRRRGAWRDRGEVCQAYRGGTQNGGDEQGLVHALDSMAGEKLVASRGRGAAVHKALWVGPLPFRTPPAAGQVYVGKLWADGEAEQRMINLFASANLHKLPIQTSEYCN